MGLVFGLVTSFLPSRGSVGTVGYHTPIGTIQSDVGEDAGKHSPWLRRRDNSHGRRRMTSIHSIRRVSWAGATVRRSYRLQSSGT